MKKIYPINGTLSEEQINQVEFQEKTHYYSLLEELEYPIMEVDDAIYILIFVAIGFLFFAVHLDILGFFVLVAALILFMPKLLDRTKNSEVFSEGDYHIAEAVVINKKTEQKDKHIRYYVRFNHDLEIRVAKHIYHKLQSETKVLLFITKDHIIGTCILNQEQESHDTEWIQDDVAKELRKEQVLESSEK